MMDQVNLGRVTVSLVARPQGTPSGGHQPQQAQTTSSLTLEEAQRRASFHFGPPGYVPLGYRFLDAVYISGIRELVILTYVNSDKSTGGWFAVIQAPLAQYESGNGASNYLVVGDVLGPSAVGPSVAAALERVARPGTDLKVLTLVWENGDLLQHLEGHNLPEAELQRIAASVL